MSENNYMLDELEKDILNIDWDSFPDMASINSRHEYVKAEVISFGKGQGFISVPEINPSGDVNKRVDVGWFRDGGLRYAFEVDGSIKAHSVKKLNMFGEGVVKVIISKSPNRSLIRRNMGNLPDHFCHIDARLDRYF